MILTGFHKVGMTKRLTAKQSHQQGPCVLQLTACKKIRRLHEVFALQHSHPLLTPPVTSLGTGGNKTAQQVSNHTLVSIAREAEAAVPAIHSTLSDQHFMWQMCLKNHCNQCCPTSNPSQLRSPSYGCFFPNNLQLLAFAWEYDMLLIPRKLLVFLAELCS